MKKRDDMTEPIGCGATFVLIVLVIVIIACFYFAGLGLIKVIGA